MVCPYNGILCSREKQWRWLYTKMKWPLGLTVYTARCRTVHIVCYLLSNKGLREERECVYANRTKQKTKQNKTKPLEE